MHDLSAERDVILILGSTSAQSVSRPPLPGLPLVGACSLRDRRNQEALYV